MKKLLLEDFDNLKKMSVKEYTLFQKWYEINNKEWTSNELQRIWEVKNSIWFPKDPNDYKKIEPDIINVNDKNTMLTWNILRIFISTMPWKQNVGRLMRFIIVDKKTMGYLGVLSLASDFISLSPRDNFIGWTYDHRINKKMLAYTAMGSSIVPTQPIGFNYTGGKLMTLMLCTDKIVNLWNEKYKERLIGITTTSLYGGYSQYNGLKHWKKCGTSKGKIPLEPSEETYQKIRQWVKETYPKDFERITVNKNKVLSRPKSRLLSFAYTRLKVKPPENNAPRGVYFCELYDNSREFLSMKTKDFGNVKFNNSVDTLFSLWIEKYAKKRISNIMSSKRYNTNSLFYDNIIDKSWEETKRMYINES